MPARKRLYVGQLNGTELGIVVKLKLQLLRQAAALQAQGNFSKAAEAMSLSQSTLSKGIRELEAQVGAEIFERNQTPVALTDFGRMFMQQAAELLIQAEQLERLALVSQKQETPVLRVCFGPYAFAALAPKVVPAFAAAHPSVQLQIDFINPSKAPELLRSQATDLVIAESTVFDQESIVADLEPMPGCVVLRKGHPLLMREEIKMSDIALYPSVQVTMLPPRVLKAVVLSSAKTKAPLQRAQNTPATSNISSVDLAMDIVQATDAYAFSTLGLAQARFTQGLLRPALQEPWMYAKWSIAVAADRSPAKSLLAFCALVKTAHNELLAEEKRLGKKWPVHTSNLSS